MCAGRPPVSTGDGRSIQEHVPVLLQEALAALALKPEGLYVDATFGRGGHTNEILRQLTRGKVLVIDKDVAAIEVARQLRDERVVARQGSFANLQQWIEELGWTKKVNGVLLDLGVSSPQLDDEKRGFSFMRNGPLDMRMDASQPLTAAKWLKRATEREIAQVLRDYGEERFSQRIARAIVKARAQAAIETTAQLAEIVKQAHPAWEKYKHPATRTFQALRIVVNDELNELRSCLEQSLEVLAIGGRLAVIGFHSLEDRIVKEFMRKHLQGPELKKLPLRQAELNIRLKRIGRTITPTAAEINQNPRARSAHLRIAEKIA